MSSPLSAFQPWPSLFPLTHQTKLLPLCFTLILYDHFSHFFLLLKCLASFLCHYGYLKLLLMLQNPSQMLHPPGHSLGHLQLSSSSEHLTGSSFLESITFCHASQSVTSVSGPPSRAISSLKVRLTCNTDLGEHMAARPRSWCIIGAL